VRIQLDQWIRKGVLFTLFLLTISLFFSWKIINLFRHTKTIINISNPNYCLTHFLIKLGITHLPRTNRNIIHWFVGPYDHHISTSHESHPKYINKEYMQVNKVFIFCITMRNYPFSFVMLKKKLQHNLTDIICIYKTQRHKTYYDYNIWHIYVYWDFKF